MAGFNAIRFTDSHDPGVAAIPAPIQVPPGPEYQA